jgi:hypothetical protein
MRQQITLMGHMYWCQTAPGRHDAFLLEKRMLDALTANKRG